MKEYIFLLLGVIVISGVIGMIAPETPIKRYVSLLIALCILSAAVKPIGELIGMAEGAELGIFSGEGSEMDYESVYRETLISGNEESFCRLLKSKMSRELGIDPEHFDVYADMYISDSEYKLERVSVVLYGMGITQDPEKLRSYTGDLLGVECEIIYG
ncbi:MAG: hypothetical protein IKL59_01455 [Clostridia bacterium]|nr:hypothetical protein [Clostridia bacterium]